MPHCTFTDSAERNHPGHHGIRPTAAPLSLSTSDTLPKNQVLNNQVVLEHEATVSKVSEEQLFYLMSRGISQDDAVQMIIMGFIEPFTKELPMEYAVEMNRLINFDMEGSIG